MELIFDSRNRRFKEPFGCAKKGENVEYSVMVSKCAEEVFLLMQKDGQEEQWVRMERRDTNEDYDIYHISVPIWEEGLYFYRFCVRKDGRDIFFGHNEENAPSSSLSERWHLLCYDDALRPPAESMGKVYYQIFPDRFYQLGTCDTKDKLQPFWVHENKSDVPHYLPDERGEIKNNDFFGGNLAGIAEKLDYLSSLGVQVLYLNPIFMAYSNHRYDTADYHRIDPLLGTEQDFCKLCDLAHQKGMRLILDGVFSHTGDRSIYFDRASEFGGGAVSKDDSPYRKWYRFHNYPHEYESWWGIQTLPCVEETEPSYQEFIITGQNSVVRHWLRLGADGYRLDVVDELPDCFLEKLYKTVKEEKTDAIVIGEVWEDASDKISYGVRRKYLWGRELDGVMNYVYRAAIIDFVSGKISGKSFMERVMRLAEHYPHEVLCSSMSFLSTHDTVRILTLFAGPDGMQMTREERACAQLSEEEIRRGEKLLSAAIFLLFTLPGSPCIYYGDEIGMQGYEDPFNRRFFDWKKSNHKIMQEYGRLSKLHRVSEALRKGTIRTISAQGGLVIFSRQSDREELLCAVNVSAQAEEIRLGECEPLIFSRCLNDEGTLTVLPYGYVVW